MGSRDEYVDAIKLAFVVIATRSTLLWAAAFMGIFNTPFFRTIIETIAQDLFTFLANKTELGAFFYYIDTRTATEGRDFMDAAKLNQKAQQHGSLEEKKIAEEKLWDTFYIFAKLTS